MAYFIEGDLVVSEPVLVHVDKETGAEVSEPGEGVQSFCLPLRQSWGIGEKGVQARGTVKVQLASAFQAKAPKNPDKPGRAVWYWEPGSLPVLGHPPVGAWVVGRPTNARYPIGGPILREAAAVEASADINVVRPIIGALIKGFLEDPELIAKMMGA